MSCIGIDIGSENCVIAVVKERGIDVVLNDESNRETPGVVSFGEKQRFIGSAGAAAAMMNPKSTISQLKRMIGRKFDDPVVQNELNMLPFRSSRDNDGGIVIHLNYLGKEHAFTPVDLLGMFLSHLKNMTERKIGAPVSDCVIGIPSYFSDSQRRAYLNAAAIAGLKPSRLMHDCTATALSYGIYKTDFSTSGPTFVVFVDIGQSDTQVAVASFEAGAMRILSHAFDSNLGGKDFDEILFAYFAEQFHNEHGIDVCSNVRSCIRLRTACENLKKILSANAEAPLNIECLIDEKDVKGFIKREEFEKLSSGLLERVSVPCKKAVADAGLSSEKIQSVELVGSGSRVPSITKLLSSLFGREPRRTLNASECVARGCALQCAMLSPSFLVKDYEVEDCLPFSIGLLSDERVIHNQQSDILFPNGQAIPSLKVLTFQRCDSCHLEAFYANPGTLPSDISLKFSSFMVDPFQGSYNKKARLKVKVQLNIHGIVVVESAVLIEEHADDSISSGDSQIEMDMNKLDTGKIASFNEDNAGAHHELIACANGMIRNGVRQRIEIPVSEHICHGMTKADVLESQKKEQLLAQQDRTVEQAKDRKNALESFVYETRNKLYNTYWSFATDREKERAFKSLQEIEEWLYEDGDDETEGACVTKLQALKNLVDPIEDRYKDEEARMRATRNLSNCIGEYRMCIESFSSHDNALISNECDKVENWLREATQRQDVLPKNIDPILRSSDIEKMMDDLNRTCNCLSRNADSLPISEPLGN